MRRYGDDWLKFSVAAALRRNAVHCGFYRGTSSVGDLMTLDACTADHIPSGTRLIYTRETGYHSSGWWKNPDYERCWHLSLSFRDPETGEYAPFNQKVAKEWLDYFFGGEQHLLWCEPPATEHGRKAGVWHFRLFCDEGWQPIKPRGEVYSTDLTEAGYRSFSELKWEQEKKLA